MVRLPREARILAHERCELGYAFVGKARDDHRVDTTSDEFGDNYYNPKTWKIERAKYG